MDAVEIVSKLCQEADRIIYERGIDLTLGYGLWFHACAHRRCG